MCTLNDRNAYYVKFLFQINFLAKNITTAGISFLPGIQPNNYLTASNQDTSLSSNGCMMTASQCRGNSTVNGSVKLLMFTCLDCVYSTNKILDLKRHIETFNHKTLRILKCCLCEYGNNQKGNQNRHVGYVHKCLQKYKCSQCEYATNESRDLGRHVQRTHEILFKLKCSQCEYGTNCKRTLRKHVENVHEKLQKFKCSQCKYATNQKGRLNMHVKCVHENL